MMQTLKQYITHFLAAKRATKSAQTAKNYEQALRYLCDHIAAAGFAAWPTPPEALDSFFGACRERELSDSTLDCYFRSIRTFYNWCEKRGKLSPADNPIKQCEKPRRVVFLPKAVPENNIGKLLATLRAAAEAAGWKETSGQRWIDCRDYCLIALALDTGLRLSELARLTVDKIDLEHRTISLEAGKDRKERKAVFSSQAGEILAKWRNLRDNICEARGYPTAALFITDQRAFNCSLTARGISRIFALWQNRAGVKRVNFHRLRHTHAVYFLREHGDLLDLQRQLGHANIATTQIYCRVDDTGRAVRLDAASPLGRIMNHEPG